jgi:hypothetical protein
MGRAKKHTPEQIVNLLRRIKVAIVNGKMHSVGLPDVLYQREC